MAGLAALPQVFTALKEAKPITQVDNFLKGSGLNKIIGDKLKSGKVGRAVLGFTRGLRTLGFGQRTLALGEQPKPIKTLKRKKQMKKIATRAMGSSKPAVRKVVRKAVRK